MSHLLVPDLGQRWIHHQNQPDGNGDIGRVHLEPVPEVHHPGEKVPPAHPMNMARKIQRVRNRSKRITFLPPFVPPSVPPDKCIKSVFLCALLYAICPMLSAFLRALNDPLRPEASPQVGIHCRNNLPRFLLPFRTAADRAGRKIKGPHSFPECRVLGVLP